MSAYRVMIQDRETDAWSTQPGRYDAVDHGSDDAAYRAARDMAFRIRSSTGVLAVVVPDRETD
jgi:hypothetical protein